LEISKNILHQQKHLLANIGIDFEPSEVGSKWEVIIRSVEGEYFSSGHFDTTHLAGDEAKRAQHRSDLKMHAVEKKRKETT